MYEGLICRRGFDCGRGGREKSIRVQSSMRELKNNLPKTQIWGCVLLSDYSLMRTRGVHKT